MIGKEAMDAALAAYDIEAACILEMKQHFDPVQFSKAMALLSLRRPAAVPSSLR